MRNCNSLNNFNSITLPQRTPHTRLTSQGYGQETDLWSVGVIMCLVLCGKLPFDGATQEEIVRATLRAELYIKPEIWDKLSLDAQNMMRCLLNRDPK